MRTAFVYCLAMLLSGCTSGEQLIQATEVRNVFGYVSDVEKLSGSHIVDGSDLILAAYYVTDDRCQKFFDNLEANKARLLFASKTTTGLTSLAVQALSALTNAQREIGVVSASGTFLANTIQDYNTVYNLAPYSGQIHKLVGEAQAAYIDHYEPIRTQLEQKPITKATTFYKAAVIAQGYARLCSYSQFSLFVETALNKAKAKLSTDVVGDAQVQTFAYRRVIKKRSDGGFTLLPPFVAD